MDLDNVDFFAVLKLTVSSGQLVAERGRLRRLRPNVDLLLDEKLRLGSRSMALLGRLGRRDRLVFPRTTLATAAVNVVQSVCDLLLELDELLLYLLRALAHLERPKTLPPPHDVEMVSKLSVLNLGNRPQQLGVSDPVVVELRHERDKALH